MSETASAGRAAPNLVCEEVRPSRAVSTLAEDVVAGLFSRPRMLPPKYFYDAAGSALFERICESPEYYLTRTEDTLLGGSAEDVVARTRPQWVLELGSGSSRKTQHLLDACTRAGARPVYLPFDVSRTAVMEAGRRLAGEYDWLRVHALVGDYLAGLDHVPRQAARGLVVFLGSTLGNFAHDEAVGFLNELRGLMGSEGRLLLGADRVKAPATLHAAYNDAAGITARFNRNVLEVLNRELGADFDPRAFHHYAPYDPASAQVEMYLVAARAQRVHIATLGRTLALAEGEAIRTEISRKFTRERLEALLAEAGLAVEQHYEAAAGAFSLVLAGPA